MKICLLLASLIPAMSASAQIGRRFPSEKKIVPDPVTGVPLAFLTSGPADDRKIYPTHPQWTADGKWLVFTSDRARGQALAVNEGSGDIVQITESGFRGTLCVGRKTMRLFFNRPADGGSGREGPMEIVAINLEKVFADSAAGTMKPAASYEQVFGSVPPDIGGGGDLAIDENEEFAYFRANRESAAKLLPEGTRIESDFGPRGMGEGPSGIAGMNLKTGEAKIIAAVPFQAGHIQSNPYLSGEIVFCWETGGKSPQRTWTVKSDGTGLRPLFPEAAYDWVTHEAVISKDEVAIAILGHREVGTDDGWGPSGTREHPTGLGIVNLRTREVRIAGQTKSGSGLWHVHGSADGRWAVGDDFDRSLYLIDRHTSEMMLLTAGHKETAADHPHPTFSPDGTRLQIQSAMLAEDGRALDICIVPVPEAWLARKSDER